MSKISAKDSELLKRIDEVLHYLWDPIGVRGIPEARDEYDSYVGHIFTMLKQNADVERLSKHLCEIRRVNMGMGPCGGEEEVAMVLIAWENAILDE